MWRYVSGSLGCQNLKSLNLKLTRGSLSNIVYRESYIGIRFGLGDSLPDKAYCGVQTHRVQYTFHGICRTRKRDVDAKHQELARISLRQVGMVQ